LTWIFGKSAEKASPPWKQWKDGAPRPRRLLAQLHTLDYRYHSSRIRTLRILRILNNPQIFTNLKKRNEFYSFNTFVRLSQLVEVFFRSGAQRGDQTTHQSTAFLQGANWNYSDFLI